MPPASRWGYTGLTVGIVMAVGSWLLYQVGWLAALDGAFYDQVFPWTTRWREPEPKVMLLRLEDDDFGSQAEAIRTLDVLDDWGARAVVFNFLPRQSSPEFFRRAAELRNVVFGRARRPDPDNPDVWKLEAWPAAAQGLDLPWGVVFLPPSQKGIHRQHQTVVTVGTNTFPTLESRVASLCASLAPERLTEGPFLINFAGGSGSLPNASLSKALAGELIPELVEGRVVMVGTADGLLRLETPVSEGADAMTFLEFQGHALQTLIDGRAIRPLGAMGTLLLLMGMGIVSALLYQRVNSAAGARLVITVLLLAMVAAIACLEWLSIWLPLGPVVLAQTGQFGLTLVYKTRMTNRALNEMRLHVLAQIKERVSPQHTMLSPEYWDHLVSMIHQTLEVERMVFFERVPHSQYMQETKAFHCLFEDLREKERTLDAAVFAQALAGGGPVRVTGFFEDGPGPEVEYVCPLVFAGEVMGIWAVSLDATGNLPAPQLEARLMKFSHQVARLLYFKQREAPKQSLAVRFKDWFSEEKEDLAYRELRRTADMLQQYYDAVETALSQIGSAMIVYDFLGRVLMANEPARDLLRTEGLAPANATALDFLGLVTGKDDAQVRSLLRSVLLEGSPASTSVKLATEADRQFLLRAYPLPGHDEKSPLREPYRVGGMVCELIETTSLSTLASLKGVVADRLGVELRDHLAAIEISASLMELDGLSEAQRRAVLDAIHHKAGSCVRVISECQKYLGRHVDADAMGCFPVDALALLGQASAALGTRTAERKVTLQVEQPRLMDQVLASTSELERLFSATLELLLTDAAENTALTIKVEDGPDFSTFRFSNCGFGIPNERLQQILTNPEIPTSDEFRTLREALAWVANWGGHLGITSEVGRGYGIILQLRQFKLAAFLPSQKA